ncbi:hypothetical protein ETU09_01240 [Apibacter muscae]|uniref:Uncharacterized protein n=1 Tax=Apibacter muscae TaxID=2509004 RepID=A0A563DLH3_9FLAO|nr:hypothetical protein [Apibacter muscae]TWP30654.1 hypothetical protein ETU09_01240 [Apibacter muscae]
MPWHTIDGLFFLSFSFLFFTKEKYILSVIFACIAATTKQSFYIDLLVVFFTNLLFYFYQIKNKLIDIKSFKKDVFFGLFVSIVLVFILLRYQIFENRHFFFAQTHVNNSINNFIRAGFKDFLFSEGYFRIVLVIGISLLVFIQLIYNKKIKKIWNLIIYLALFLLYLGPLINYFLIKSDISFEGSKTVFLLLIIFFIKEIITHKISDLKKILSIIILFFITWSISLSWGYSNVLLMLPILLLAFNDEFKFSEKLNFVVVILLIVLFFIYRFLSPYFNKNILEVNYIFTKENIPVYSGMLISERDYQYIKEAQKLNNKYKNIIFLPGSPIYDVMFDNNLNRSPWEMDVEYPNWKKDFDELSKRHDIYYILDKNEIINSKQGFFKSSFTQRVKQEKKLIDSTDFYYIYK